MMEYNKVQATAEAMQRHGGGFVKALGDALMQADPDNRESIHKAFPKYWDEYRTIAERNNWYTPE